MALVTAILLMFLGTSARGDRGDQHPTCSQCIRVVLLARNKSANLLSIRAVDFGIIVDSSVIIVEVSIGT